MQGVGEWGRWGESLIKSFELRGHKVLLGKKENKQTKVRKRRKRTGSGGSEDLFLFWFRSGRGCGPDQTLSRGGLHLCDRASCASCIPFCPCGGDDGNDELAGLGVERRRKDHKSKLIQTISYLYVQ